MRAEYAASDEEAFRYLVDEGFYILTAVVLDGPPAGPSAPAPGGPAPADRAREPTASPDPPEGGSSRPAIDPGPAGLTVIARRPGYTRVRTTGGAPAWVVFSELHYPGWRASLDGQPAPVLRANTALVAVAVPAGERVVELRFADPRPAQGLALSLVSAALLALSALAGNVRRL
jgi:hypothetical protein